MPTPWGRVFWTFVMGLCAGIVTYAIYRGDLRWELPQSVELRAPASEKAPADPSLPPATDLAESRDEATPPPVAPTPTEDTAAPETQLAEPAGDPEAAETGTVPDLLPDETAVTVQDSPAPAPLPLEAKLPEPTPAPEEPVVPPPPKESPVAKELIAAKESPEAKDLVAANESPPALKEPPAAKEPERDWLIVPGVRVGEIVPTITESQLASIYGARNVKAVEVSLGDGFSEPGTAVFAKDAQREVEILWTGSGPNRKPRLVRVKGKSWKTAEGIALGTSLRQLESLNGGPFTLSGFGWAYSGAVVSWGNGKLGPLLQSRGRVQLWLKPPPNASPGKLVGDKDFRSSNSAMRTLNPRVYALTVEFPSASDAAKR